MKFSKPSSPFESLEFFGNSVTIDTNSNYLILPTSSKSILSTYNQYILNEDRALTSGTYNFTDDDNENTGLWNIIHPWIAVCNSSSSVVDFYLFSARPKNLSIKVNSSGNIYELTLYRDNYSIFRGQITHANLTLDSNSDLIPDVFDSLTNFLKSYDFLFHMYVASDNVFYQTSDGKTMEFLQ